MRNLFVSFKIKLEHVMRIEGTDTSLAVSMPSNIVDLKEIWKSDIDSISRQNSVINIVW